MRANPWTMRGRRAPYWTVGVVVVCAIAAAVFLTRGSWGSALAHSLVCAEETARPDAILLDNVDPDYAMFERAAALHAARRDLRIFVLVKASSKAALADVNEGIVDLMARIAGLPEWQAIPFREIEPISLNAAHGVRDRFLREQVSSVAIVTPGFRSRRAALVYASVLRDAGIRATCIPVFGTFTPDTWTDTLHGFQEVTLQFVKLQYYRLWVMPMKAGA